jgi:hypothetical protein
MDESSQSYAQKVNSFKFEIDLNKNANNISNDKIIKNYKNIISTTSNSNIIYQDFSKYSNNKVLNISDEKKDKIKKIS